MKLVEQITVNVEGLAQLYIDEVYNGDTDFKDEAENVIRWMCRGQFQKLKENNLIKMADEYAKYLSPDNKAEQQMISLDCLGFLNCVLSKYRIASKDVVIQNYKKLKAKPAGFYNEYTLVTAIALLEELFGKENLENYD